MIIQQWKVDWMLQAIETDPEREFQTRRPKKLGEERRWMDRDRPGQLAAIPDIIRPPSYTLKTIIVWGRNGTWRIKHQVGRDYAVQPGQGKWGLWLDPSGNLYTPNHHFWPGIGRKQGYRELRQLITDIREQRLQDISEEDCLAEGVFRVSWEEKLYPWANISSTTLCASPQEAYRDMWEALGYPKGKRWENNPVVFAYSFRLKAVGG